MSVCVCAINDINNILLGWGRIESDDVYVVIVLGLLSKSERIYEWQFPSLTYLDNNLSVCSVGVTIILSAPFNRNKIKRKKSV